MALVNILCTPLAWLCSAVAPVLQPVLDFTGSTLFAILAAVLFGVIWIALSFGEKSYCVNMKAAEVEFKVQMTWLMGAFLVGFLGALSGEHCNLSFLGDTSVVAVEKMTLLNVMEWAPYAKIALIAMLYGLLLCVVLYSICSGVMSAVRVLSGFPFFFFVGKAIMLLRVTILLALEDSDGLLYLLRAILSFIFAFVDVIPVILLPILFVVSLMSSSDIAELNKRRTIRYGRPSRAFDELYGVESDSSSAVSDPEPAVPTYVTDDQGNSYTVHYSAGFIYLDTPNGKYSTKWEYVKGQSYFDLNGTRFYPHS